MGVVPVYYVLFCFVVSRALVSFKKQRSSRLTPPAKVVTVAPLVPTSPAPSYMPSAPPAYCNLSHLPNQPPRDQQSEMFEILFRPDQSFRRRSTATRPPSAILPSWLVQQHPNAVDATETHEQRAARYNGPYNVYVNDTRAAVRPETDAARAARYNGSYNSYVNDNVRPQ